MSHESETSRNVAPHVCLTDLQIDEYLALIELGAPPTVACQKLGVTYEQVESSLVRRPAFHDRLERAKRLLAGNAAAALYKKAMSGCVTAQIQYLREFGRQSFDPLREQQKLSVEELDEILRDYLDSKSAQEWAEEPLPNADDDGEL